MAVSSFHGLAFVQFVHFQCTVRLVAHPVRGHAKPWHAWVQTWDVVKEYAALQQKSPWKDHPPIPARTHKHMHQAARTARMYGHYGEMVKWYLKYLGAKL